MQLASKKPHVLSLTFQVKQNKPLLNCFYGSFIYDVTGRDLKILWRLDISLKNVTMGERGSTIIHLKLRDVICGQPLWQLIL